MILPSTTASLLPPWPPHCKGKHNLTFLDNYWLWELPLRLIQRFSLSTPRFIAAYIKLFCRRVILPQTRVQPRPLAARGNDVTAF